MLLIVGPANGRHVPPSGSAEQSVSVQQVVEHLRAPVGLLGSMGLHAPLLQSEAIVQLAPNAAFPVPAIPVCGARHTFTT